MLNIEIQGGPTVPWRAGRQDAFETSCTPDGRLPDAGKKADHIRDVFYRMVCLNSNHVTQPKYTPGLLLTLSHKQINRASMTRKSLL